MKKPRSLPSPEVLRQLLRYDPETGKLFWLPRSVEWFEDGMHSAEHCMGKWNSKNAGNEAFTAYLKGYRQGQIFNHRYYAHRVIWLMIVGELPAQIDHLNGNRGDNRWRNLRAASASMNSRNSARRLDNKSGMSGVSWARREQRWRARINDIEGKEVYLGYFKSFEDAVSARKSAELMHGYHVNHGRRGHIDERAL
jgi:hypothetical protein